MRRFVSGSWQYSAVIDQFVRQIERDPPNGSLFSDRLWEGQGQLSCIPGRALRLDGRMDVRGGVVGKFGAKKRIALCTTCKRVPSIVDVFQK